MAMDSRLRGNDNDLSFIMHEKARAMPPSPPSHVAIIMDGNGRWASKRGLPRVMGHRQGAESVRTAIKTSIELGVSYLTLYAFSSENWSRPAEEVEDLMNLLRFYLGKELDSLHEQGVRVRFIGDRTRLAEDILQQMLAAEARTAANTKLNVNIALSYGSRQEIIHAIQTIAQQVKSGELSTESITESTISDHLYTVDIPDPDLLIRTSGEERLSNFLLWQMAYTELYFTDVLWPDFSAEHFRKAVDAYIERDRRYGVR
ncbi:MAG: ispU [Rickettsiales bacterium]|jgi:undecaprenyl diphosphate synthase|nr:ispU [Rickettsiales bacterium]